jgi:hypothetical protein
MSTYEDIGKAINDIEKFPLTDMQQFLVKYLRGNQSDIAELFDELFGEGGAIEDVDLAERRDGPVTLEFECELCHSVLDIADSVTLPDGRLVCPACVSPEITSESKEG